MTNQENISSFKQQLAKQTWEDVYKAENVHQAYDMFMKKNCKFIQCNLSGEKGQSKGMQQRQTLDHKWANKMHAERKTSCTYNSREPEMMREIQYIKHIKTN